MILSIKWIETLFDMEINPKVEIWYRILIVYIFNEQ